MAGGQEGGSSTTVQKADPWEGQQPYLKEVFSEAQNIYNKPGPSYYPGETVVPFSPETNLALDWQSQRAVQGSPIQAAANDQLVSTMNGDYLYGGPGFNSALTAAKNKIFPMVDSTFEAGGRSHSGLADVAKTQALGDSFANLYAGERQNQLRGMFFAPQIANQDYQDIGKLAEVGAQKEGMAQQTLLDKIERYNYEQGLPDAKLANYMNMIQGSYGGSQTTTSPLYQNQGAGLLGGAMSGVSIASALGVNPLYGLLGAFTGFL